MSTVAPPPSVVPPGAVAAPLRRRPVMLWAAAGLALAAALGAGAWLLLPRFVAAAKPAEGHAARAAADTAVPLGAVVVNLAGDPRRYLRVAVGLGVPGPKDAKDVEARKAQLLDLLISVFSSAPPDTFASEDGRAALKRQLLDRIRRDLGLAKVGRVYFTELVIQ